MKNNISSLSDIYNLVVENYVSEYNISASAKELWLDSLEPISMDGNVVTLATDTEFKRNTIISIYLEKLEEQFTNVLGNPIKVEIIIKDDLPTTETKFNDIRNSRELTIRCRMRSSSKFLPTLRQRQFPRNSTKNTIRCLYMAIPDSEKLIFCQLSRTR